MIIVADERFGNASFLYSLSDKESTKILHELMSSYSKFCIENGVTSWLAHGTLIGYFWGQKQLPWDSDIGLYLPE
jgi:phosphorylcholine metabolism protein LicD